MPVRPMGLGDFCKSILLGGKTDVFARYELLREAISGTMSQFYKARDRKTGEIVGLKILDKEKTAALEARFKGLSKPSEGKVAIALRHPRIVKTFSHGTTTGGEPFLVMEFLDGPGLNSLIIGRDERLDGQRLHLLRQAAEAISAVHRAGYIHRDVCPRNFVCSEDVTSVALIDFGLTVPATPEFMQPGNRTGTPNYMAPELVRRRPTDHRLDVFAFGVSAYELFAFDFPWAGGRDGQSAMTRANVKPTPIQEHCPQIHPHLARAIMRCISRDPNQRPDTMDRFSYEIRRVKSDHR